MLDRWVEVGNSGMFRPEMLEPMGFPKDVRVHGWGLSLERPTMIRQVQSISLSIHY
jgi:phenylalanyl-tRNA synthetase alpha chain